MVPTGFSLSRVVFPSVPTELSLSVLRFSSFFFCLKDHGTPVWATGAEPVHLMDEVLSAALSTDNTVRRRAEATLSYLRSQRGFSVALAKRLASTAATAAGATGSCDPGGDAADEPVSRRQIGSLAGVLLQHFVTDLWEVADHSVLPQEDKEQVGQPG